MRVLKAFFSGLISVISLQASGLYRFPYRNSAEGLRADTLKIGDDMRYVLDDYEQQEK